MGIDIRSQTHTCSYSRDSLTGLTLGRSISLSALLHIVSGSKRGRLSRRC
jgi:hypothetical protein